MYKVFFLAKEHNTYYVPFYTFNDGFDLAIFIILFLYITVKPLKCLRPLIFANFANGLNSQNK